jgi:hypothetical protein
VNDVATLVIYFAHESKHMVKLVVIHQFSFNSQKLDMTCCEVGACAMRDVANCDMACDVVIANDVDQHYKYNI